MTGSTGLVFVTANVLAGQTGIPLPVVPTLIVAGALATEHYGWGSEVFVGATLACLLVDCGWYFLGRKYSARFKWLSFPMFARSRGANAARAPEKWGMTKFVAAKCVPGLAFMTSPLAGASRMSFYPFLWLSAVGAALWVGACLIAGALFHQQIHELVPRISQYGGWATGVIVLLLIGYMVVPWLTRRRRGC